MKPSIRPLGDSAAIVQWAGCDDTKVCRAVWQLTDALNHHARSEFGRYLVAVVPAFASVTIHFCLKVMSFNEAKRVLELALENMESRYSFTPKNIEIPVCFDACFALDLAELAGLHGLEQEEVIRRFCEGEYAVRMIGFSPGFPYLSGLPGRLATPRRSSPRFTVPQGSVAIGGSQAGIYSQETPGGWNIIGRTPLSLFRAEHTRPCLLTAGDQVRFVRICSTQFQTWQDEQ